MLGIFFPPIVARNFESKAFGGGGVGWGSNSHTIFVKIPLQFVMSGPNQMGLSTCDQHFCLELWGNWIRGAWPIHGECNNCQV